jgi:phage repressor protein C with HTH and peptisase S24 domain
MAEHKQYKVEAVKVPKKWKTKAFIDKDEYEKLYRKSVEKPDKFWGKEGKRIDWIKPYTQVKNTSFAYPDVSIKWFEDGTRVTEIDVRASAGPGAIHEGFEEVKQVWYFPEDVIRHELRARISDLRMITIDGDSMEPLLSSGDRVLIDTSQRMPVPPGIFAIWDGMGLVAKRIEHEPNSDPAMVMIKSVNPEYQTYQRMAEEVHIIGRVVWTSRRL